MYRFISIFLIFIMTIKTLSFSAWLFREKNIIGGISLIILALTPFCIIQSIL